MLQMKMRSMHYKLSRAVDVPVCLKNEHDLAIKLLYGLYIVDVRH
jgi:hypothetical protein